MWLALLAIHLIGLVGFNLVLRRSVLAKVDRFVLATVMQTGIAIPAVVLLFIFPPQFSQFTLTDILLIGAATLLTIGLQITNVKAVQYLEASVYSIVYNLRIILTTILGIVFLNESTDLLRILGGVLILLAIITVKQRGSRVNNATGIKWALGAVVVLSFLNLTEKTLINEIGFLNYFPISVTLAAIIMWVYLLISKRKVNAKQLIQPKMLQLMTLRALSAYGFSGALAVGALISVANYVSGMSVILTVLLGAVWLKERDYLGRKLLATGVAVIGLTLILLSGI